MDNPKSQTLEDLENLDPKDAYIIVFEGSSIYVPIQVAKGQTMAVEQMIEWAKHIWKADNGTEPPEKAFAVPFWAVMQITKNVLEHPDIYEEFLAWLVQQQRL